MTDTTGSLGSCNIGFIAQGCFALASHRWARNVSISKESCFVLFIVITDYALGLLYYSSFYLEMVILLVTTFTHLIKTRPLIAWRNTLITCGDMMFITCSDTAFIPTQL